MKSLVRLAGDVSFDGGLTIDFAASRELGHPLVVVRVPSPAPTSPCLKGLTEREREVAALITEGLSNKEIARRLFISLPTVKDHVHHILEKSGLSSRAAVVAAVLGREPNRAASETTETT